MREGNWAKLPFAKTSGTVTGNRANKLAKGPVIIYCLGGGGDKRGDQLKLRTQKGGSLKTLEGFRGGTTQTCLVNEDMVGGLQKSSNVIRGDHFSEVTIKRGIGNITLFPPPATLPQAINNDRSLIAE